MKSQENLSEIILDFMSIVSTCLKETTYTNDRINYERDLAYASIWLIKLHNGENKKVVINEILDIATSKFIYDVFKQGDWGNQETAAFKNLQTKLNQFK